MSTVACTTFSGSKVHRPNPDFQSRTLCGRWNAGAVASAWLDTEDACGLCEAVHKRLAAKVAPEPRKAIVGGRCDTCGRAVNNLARHVARQHAGA